MTSAQHKVYNRQQRDESTLLYWDRATEATAARQGGYFPVPGALDSHCSWHCDESCAQGTAGAGAARCHASGSIPRGIIIDIYVYVCTCALTPCPDAESACRAPEYTGFVTMRPTIIKCSPNVEVCCLAGVRGVVWTDSGPVRGLAAHRLRILSSTLSAHSSSAKRPAGRCSLSPGWQPCRHS
jgi:hypothetical protein